MPTINLISDVHLEFGKYEPLVDDEMQAIIIAGDLSPGLTGIEFLEELEHRSKAPIIYVPGNHCFWYADYFPRLEFLKKQCDRIGVHFLYNESVTINNTVYLGTTLWTDFRASGNQPLALTQAGLLMNDYKYIFNGELPITPEFILEENRKAVEFIRDGLNAAPTGSKTCVITHHAPILASLGEHRDHKSAAFYASDLRNVIYEHQPDLWVHGHTHHSVRIVEDETLIVCNPRGYKGVHLNKDFIPDILIEF